MPPPLDQLVLPLGLSKLFQPDKVYILKGYSSNILADACYILVEFLVEYERKLTKKTHGVST